MMKKRAWQSAGLLAGLLVAAPTCQAQEKGPKLVVMISVDQLRGDLIDRYADAFSGGFTRLLENGYSFTQASHAHAVTHTAAGHAALSTGVFPSRSGIVANSWAHRTNGQWVAMYAVEDPDSPILGVPELPGRSPRNLLRGGLADWIMAADDDARVVSLSGKDRAAITMAGKAEGHVYWLDVLLGRFITSRHYRTRYPGWVKDFNEDEMPRFTADTVWASSVPEAQRVLARADSADYEYDAVHTTMPHWAHEERDPDDQQAQNEWALLQPRVDAAVMALAKVAVDKLDLGQRGHVDYLALAVSATDKVGHSFGPLSQEQMDNLVRLDAELGDFFDYLDDEVGEGLWIVGLSGDHGVMTAPEYLKARGEAGERVTEGVRRAAVSKLLQEAAAAGGIQEEVLERLARSMEDQGIVAKAYTHTELTVGEPADSFATLFRNSYYPGRAHGWMSQLGLELRFGFEELVTAYATGTTHGSPYWYDRWVPFMVMGPGVSRGSSGGRAYSVDMAPTLAAMAGIPFPDDLDGHPIYPPIF